MSDATSYLVSKVAKVKATVDAMASWRWATVTSMDPLRVMPDGDTSPLAEAPDTLASDFGVGDRVRLVTVARRALILGRASGPRRVIGRITAPASQAIGTGTWSRYGFTSAAATILRGGVTIGKDWASMYVPLPGLYRVTGRLNYSASATNRRAVGVYVNGASVDVNCFAAGSNPVTNIVEVNDILALKAGDKLELWGEQQSGSTISMTRGVLAVNRISD